jgi:hypothetical protein
MIPMNIRFHADRDDLIFPDIEPGKGWHVEIAEIVVVENGMDAGGGKTRPSVVVRVDLPDGKSGVMMTSGRLLVTLARMIMVKFPDLMEDD